MSTPKKPGTDLAALKARLAKKKKGAEPEPAPAPVPAAAPEAADYGGPAPAAPEPAPAAAPMPEPAPAPAPQPDYGAPVPTAPVAAAPLAAAPAAAPPAAAPATDDPFGGGGVGGGGGGFDPSEGLIDVGGDVPTKGSAGLAIFVGILGIGLGAIGGFFVSNIMRNGETKENASKKGGEMALAVKEISDARIDVSKAMSGWEEKMATDPAGTAAEIDSLVKEKFAKKVNVDQLFGWQLAAVHTNGIKRTFELYDEAARLQKDLGYLSAFLSSQEKALKAGGGPSQFAVKFTDGGAVLVAAVGAVCAAEGAEGGGEANLADAKPCPEDQAAAAVGYTVLENLGAETKVFAKGTAPGQVTLLRAGGPIYDYAVGMEPNRNALIMRNALLMRAKDHLDGMSKAEKAAIKALENYADNPNVDGSADQPDPEAG